LVVDNGSTDDSVERIRDAYPAIKLIEIGRNRGFAGGNNAGIRDALAQGAEYVWLLNNDTIADPHALSAMVELAETKSNVGAVGSVLHYMDEPKQVQSWGGGRISTFWGVARYHTGPVPENLLHYITGASLLLKTEALQDVGLLDEAFFMYWEDAELGFRLRKAGWSLAVAAESHIWHKEFASVGKKSILNDVYFNFSAALFLKKHVRASCVPITFGTGGRILKRLVRTDWMHARAVIRGALGGITFREGS